MPFLAQCPNPSCGKKFSMNDESRGRTFRCKTCSTRFEATPLETAGARETAASSPALASPPSVPPGVAVAPERIGRYVLLNPLGAGAFGTVYRAHDPQLDRDVALKVLRPEVLDSSQAVERFQREAKAVAKLHHPAIVPVYDCGRDGDHHFIAYALIDGRSLADAIEPGGMEPVRAARLVARLAEGLAYAHEHKILHRDIKPANVMLDAEDHPILVDFGLARHAAGESLTALTRTGMVMGTPAYMAPEQLSQEALNVGPESDLYSLGVTLYHLLTGTIPFRGPIQAVMAQILFQSPPPLHIHRPDLDPKLEAICLKAMSRKPDMRFASARDLAAALDTWAGSSAAPTVVASKKEIPARRRRLPVMAASVALALIVCGLVGWKLYPTLFGGSEPNADIRNTSNLPRPKGPPPNLILWQADVESTFTIRVIERELVTEKVPEKYRVRVDDHWEERDREVTRTRGVFVAREFAIRPRDMVLSDVEGNRLDRQSLRRQRPVLVSSDGEPIDPYYLEQFKKDTPVIRLPQVNGLPIFQDGPTPDFALAFLDEHGRVIVRWTDACPYPRSIPGGGVAPPPVDAPKKMPEQSPKTTTWNLPPDSEFVYLQESKAAPPAKPPEVEPAPAGPPQRLVLTTTEFVLESNDVRFVNLDGTEVGRAEWSERLKIPTHIVLSFDGPLTPEIRVAFKDDTLVLLALPFMRNGPPGGGGVVVPQPENMPRPKEEKKEEKK